MKRTGIEPVSSAWKADVLPLYQRSEEQLQEPGIEPGAQRWQRWILPLNHSCNSAKLANCCKSVRIRPLRGGRLLLWIRY